MPDPIRAILFDFDGVLVNSEMLHLQAFQRSVKDAGLAELTEDEYFVTAAAAQAGVLVENHSETDPLVMLKHFGPGNPDAAPLIRK